MWVDLHNTHTQDVSAHLKAKTPTPHVCAWCKYAHTARPRVGGVRLCMMTVMEHQTMRMLRRQATRDYQ